MMRCAIARNRIARLSCEQDLGRHPWLAGHLDHCQHCAEVWCLHIRLLSELSATPPLPDFNDLTPRVLAGLRTRRSVYVPYWEWAAAAAMILAALAVGCFIGMRSAQLLASQEGVAATYQDVLSVMPSNSAEMAYGETNGSLVPAPVERRVP